MVPKRLTATIPLFFMICISSFSQQIRLRETKTGVDFLSGGKVLLTYQTSTAEVPEGVKAEFRKSGFIHPLFSPSGQELTRIQPPDHFHHYGIWGPWTKTLVEGREVDFWNLGDGKGRVDFDRLISKKEKKDNAEILVRQKHTDLLAPNGAQVAIEEDLGIRVWSMEQNRYAVDYTTEISTPLKTPVVLEAYRYGGGIGFRATARWDASNSHILTSDGKDRKTADGSYAKWVMVYGVSDDPSGESGILFLSHPDNRAHPEPMRVWPEDSNEGKENVFLEFCPIRHQAWEILPGKTNTLKYRMIVFDGKMTATEAESYWKTFAAR
ncbi:PmoA family protein [Mariniradius sediminis]|uniref:PmoA family protein n=1 Tax=Mariniradius sediminis TaxID=2909237 RepID=A0ABS9BUR5_9BACT|nr:PmoA family protein [Mariniradius sediminis]MCF1751197.1 PmoA family protein [Mariniradius sediminis]